MNNSVELFSQGLGNIVIPFFGGVPATAAIARTSVAIKSGGETRMVSILHSFFLLLTVLALSPLISKIPLSALAGILIVTAWRMNEWSAIRFYFGKKLKHAMAAFIVTLLCTVLLDLTQAILIGFAISTLVFLSEMSSLEIIREDVKLERIRNLPQGFSLVNKQVEVYHLSGPLFFAAVKNLIDKIENSDPENAILIISMRGVPLIDATGVEILKEVVERQHLKGGKVLLSGLQNRSERMLRKSGLLAQIGEENIFWSTDQAILSLNCSP